MIFQDFIWVHIIKVFGRLLESYRPAMYPQKEQVRYISLVKIIYKLFMFNTDI